MRKFKSSRFVFILLFLLSVFWVFKIYLQTAVIVGWSRITFEDLRLKNKILRIYDPTESRDLAERQMVQFLVRLELLKKYGLSPTSGDIKAEIKRIDQETLAPEKVQAIKAVFGTDEDSYVKLFVLPIWVDRKIFSLVTYGNRDIHNDSFQKAKATIAQLQGGSLEEFDQIVENNGGVIRELKVSSKNGLMWVMPESFRKQRHLMQNKGRLEAGFGSRDLALRWLQDFLQSMQPNQVASEPVDQGEKWMIPLLQKKSQQGDDTLYELKVGLFQKTDPSTWLEREGKKVFVLKLHGSSEN